MTLENHLEFTKEDSDKNATFYDMLMEAFKEATDPELQDHLKRQVVTVNDIEFTEEDFQEANQVFHALKNNPVIKYLGEALKS